MSGKPAQDSFMSDQMDGSNRISGEDYKAARKARGEESSSFDSDVDSSLGEDVSEETYRKETSSEDESILSSSTDEEQD